MPKAALGTSIRETIPLAAARLVAKGSSAPKDSIVHRHLTAQQRQYLSRDSVLLACLKALEQHRTSSFHELVITRYGSLASLESNCPRTWQATSVLSSALAVQPSAFDRAFRPRHSFAQHRSTGLTVIPWQAVAGQDSSGRTKKRL